MKPRSSIGTSDFRKIRTNGSYYVDKTALISELIRSNEEVVLLPRPRRFGKTLNLSMLQSFFEMREPSASLFEGLAVTRDPTAMAHLNRYPTLLLTFKDMAHLHWADCKKALELRISDLVGSHLPFLLQAADQAQKEALHALHMRQTDLVHVGQALQLIVRLLHQASGRKVVVLIDEYDNPLHEGKAHGYFPEIAGFMRNFLGAALKDNEHLERAVVTGILRIGRESIYSGLKNLAVYSVLEPEFASSFGFTESEVRQILVDFDLERQLEHVQHWYNGYQFGGVTIYNPWSILWMANRPKLPLQAYWINTSGNDLVRELIQQGNAIEIAELERLLAGQTVRKALDINVTMRDLSAESVWNVLLFAGYLTAVSWDPVSRESELRIPNFEILSFFKDTIAGWLGRSDKVRNLVRDLLSGNLSRFAQAMAEAVRTILSYHDTAGHDPERMFHVFTVGLMTQLSHRYRLLSNRESGHGRLDLALIPRSADLPGIVFEFKNALRMDMTVATEAALAQIEKKDYASLFRQEGVTQLNAIGLAIRGKHIAMASINFDLTTGTTGMIQHYPMADGELPSTAQAKPSRRRGAKKSHLAAQIQDVQRQKGLPQTPLEELLGHKIVILEAMASALGLTN